MPGGGSAVGSDRGPRLPGSLAGRLGGYHAVGRWQGVPDAVKGEGLQIGGARPLETPGAGGWVPLEVRRPPSVAATGFLV
ncbi:hypothetical protein NDU88_006024 [Pleurodeles waltl]|uniref:Uncharacterized protein n=1 Tax=Pleurodeles waltl TaxID=8319 RepID=A0AAV7TWG2_PLEWA|nr:hypothetical protein NDU88_006024 [Pleurodeles waltl]